MGFLCKKKKKTQSSSFNNKQSTTFEKPVVDASNRVIGATMNELGKGFGNEYTTGAQRNFMSVGDTATGALNPLIEGGLEGEAFTLDQANPWIDKFTEASAPQLKAIDDTLRKEVNILNEGAGYGLNRGRNAVARVEAAESAGDAKARVLSDAMKTGINFGAGQHQTNIGNRLNAAQLLGGTANAANQQSFNAGVVEDYGNLNRLRSGANILAGLPKNVHGTASGSSSTTTKENTDANIFGQLLGAGATVAGGLGSGGFFNRDK